jgi:hypothetical protein
MQRDDDGIDQDVQLDFYSASSQTQQMQTSYRLIKPRPVEILMFYGTEGEHINHDVSLSLFIYIYIYICIRLKIKLNSVRIRF